MPEDRRDPPTSDDIFQVEHDQTLSLLDPPPPSGPDAPAGVAAETGGEPEHIPGYRIISKLGQGGMGVAWEAEQEHPKRRVALKVMRMEHRVDEYHARMFRREVDILARLKHPNIGAIYESGHTSRGQDFFAMELVSGPTLGEWLKSRPQVVDANELELRLQLFLTISDAVHYAHQRGVIHRDLKPSNIIVCDGPESGDHSSSSSEKPAVKILDFGLARITDTDMQATMISEIGLIKGTLQYMSPEQARGQVDAVDTRSDVYALGVLLYEILTGNRPYELSPAAIAEAVRVICEEPPKPLHLSFNGARKLDADLETIVGKALEKEADRRYASAAAMADDVERHLASQPIEARPPSALYQMRKFTARNRALVGGVAAAAVMLIVFAITTTIQSGRIRAEAERAARAAEAERQVSDFMISLFDRSDPTLSRGEDLTAHQILDAGAERIEKLHDQPRAQAAFMETMGRVFTVLGDFERAEPLLDRAVDIRARFASDDQLALADSLKYRTNVLDETGRYDEAEATIRQAIDIREQILGEDPTLADYLNDLGNVLWHQGRLDEAEVIHRRALAIRENTLPERDAALAQSLHNLGALRYFAADYEEAEKLYRRSIEIEESAGGRDNHNLATSLHTLAIVCLDQDRVDEALELELESLEIREKVLGPAHPHVALSLTTLGNIYRTLDRAGEAEPLIRRALAIGESSYGPAHGEVWWMQRSLIQTLTALERYPAAEHELGRLLARAEKADSLSDKAAVHQVAGELEAAQGNWDKAEDNHRTAIAMIEEDSPGSAWVGYAMIGLARVFRDAGRLDDAQTTYRHALELMRREWGDKDPDVRTTEEELAALDR
ncbi:MAG: serine/threonine-protein kinase [Thermoanaerobaculales bacterium]|jgi:serine/threonine protein kinase/Tfp pilus assembly protein PilF|nr:serine/threonine-protein kinase [Thermoanaerobaculales bacterium]